MCGIGGIFGRDGQPVDRAALERMAEALAHRGPDGSGIFVDGEPPSIGLVSRRLAIIDLPRGNQPMSTPNGAQTIVYNGEIFNAQQLRAELAAAGHRFVSHCDTEVVLRGYVEWGTGVLERLNGMWAFAIWDRATRRLFLARDRLGIKPLVYADAAAGLSFASEIKALLASGCVSRRVDLTALPYFLSSFVVPEPYSLFHGVRRLPAGHAVLADRSGIHEFQYWDCNFEEEDDRGLAAYEEEVAGLLEESVRGQLVSDVPLGVFLSGGIDSALVTSVSAAALSEPVRTFTIGFEGSAHDERPEARNTALALGTRHAEAVVTAGEAAAVLPELLAAHDEPSQSLIQAFFISRLARQEVTVALSGVGGDELFASYPTHVVVNLLDRLDHLPPRLYATALAVARAFPGRSRRLAALAEMPSDHRVSRRLMHLVDSPTRERLIAPDLRDELDLDLPARHIEEILSRCCANDALNRLLYLYLKTYVPDELLRSLDAMSMKSSLEARVPLLDHHLVELAMRMPARHKLRLRTGKRVLRRAGARIAPPGIIRRGKRGFALPLDVWLRDELTETIRDALSEPSIRRRGIFEPREVARVVDRCLDGDARLIQPVMMLFAFESWARRVLDEPNPVPSARPIALCGPRPELSVIIVNWNTRDILRDCLRSVDAHLAAIPHEVLVVDNASVDGSVEMVRSEFPGVRLLANTENVGFGLANNEAMSVARGEWFLLLNSDTLLADDSVARLVYRARADTGIGVAHCRQNFPDGRLQHSTYRFPSLGLALVEELGLYKLLSRRRSAHLLLAAYWDQDEERDVDWVSGSFMLLPREVFEKTGGFSQDLFMYGEDMEWCYRIRDAGWRIRHYPQASIIHLDHSSSAIRWGNRRIQICLARQNDIYRRRHGRGRAAMFNLTKMAGAALRTAYFTTRSSLGGRNADYYRDMRRYYRLTLKVEAGLAVGHRPPGLGRA